MGKHSFTLPLHVRYGETDQMGVVHHASFISYLEEARTRFMEARGQSYAELERAGVGLPVRSLSICPFSLSRVRSMFSLSRHISNTEVSF